MKVFKRSEPAGSIMAALLAVAVLGLFSLTGCASAPYMPNPVDVAAGSGDDPFAGTKWEYSVGSQTALVDFYKDGTVSWAGLKPKNYTVVSGDSGYMAEIKGGLVADSFWLTIDNPKASEGNIKRQLPIIGGWGMEAFYSATKK